MRATRLINGFELNKRTTAKVLGFRHRIGQGHMSDTLFLNACNSINQWVCVKLYMHGKSLVAILLLENRKRPKTILVGAP